MNPSSPAKRRALAPLDANVNAMSPKRQLHNKTTMPGSPLKSPIKSPLGLKRSLDTVIFDENSVVPKKKQCQEPVKVAAPSPAPAPALSLRAERVSAAAASPAPAATSTPPPAPAQTEEDMPDAKEKARILRLKLGLANYKLQTGQEDVPLDRLQVKPLPGQEKRALPRVTVQPPSSRDGPPESEATIEADDRREEETQEEEVVVTKPEKATLQTVPEETSTAEDSASPVCGGAVSSLLSLARASSSVSASS
uniref:Cyclin-dependent kinase n=1 Tax=Colletotrichum fructicola (strain Nara gc5) TaxID=1213859 RepID=L2FY44_COLFN